MSADLHENLLVEFYGIEEIKKPVDDSQSVRQISSSSGVEIFERLTRPKRMSSNTLLLSDDESTRRTEADEDETDENLSTFELARSPHILPYEDLMSQMNREIDSDESPLETTSIDDEQDTGRKSTARDNFAKIVNKFTKGMRLARGMGQRQTSVGGNKSSRANSSSTSSQRFRQDSSDSVIIDVQNPGIDFLAKFDGNYLNLNDLGLETFPVDILDQIKSLKMLYLDSNHLTELPSELFSKLPHLQYLDVRNNQLKSVPSTVRGHQHLTTLLLQGNEIEKLPLELGLVPNLKNLQLGRNPLTFPPPEILDLPTSKVLNFLREKWNEANPEDRVDFKCDEELEKKSSTIICYKTPKREKKNNAQLQMSPAISIRQKTWKYRPSNRCLSAGSDRISEQKLLWMNCARELVHANRKELQKIVNDETIKNWRRNYKNNRMKSQLTNIPRKPPFALHDERNMESNKGFKVMNIDEELRELVLSLDEIDNEKSSEKLSPRSELKLLQERIEKVKKLQKRLRVCNLLNDTAN